MDESYQRAMEAIEAGKFGVAMQIAAAAARWGHGAEAIDIREAVDKAKRAQARSRPMLSQNPHRCSDGSCVLAVQRQPMGQHTNGGCRCLISVDRLRLREGIRWLAELAGREIERGELAKIGGEG